MSSNQNTTNVTVVVGGAKARKCGVCGEEGHDKRTCRSAEAVAARAAVASTSVPASVVPVVDTAAIQANHLRFISREQSGPCRLIDPAGFWAALGPDSGTYPFQRDMKGCMHLPAIAMGSGSIQHRGVLEKMPEYRWDADKKLYYRVGGCPGCN
jgi:hypothetical protein